MSKRGIDTLLNTHGKSIPTGQEIRFTLVKGPNFPLAPDPVNSKAPKEQFPLIAKFGESVVKPNFQQPPWSTARLYQQDVPKAQDDSDEEQQQLQMERAKKRWRPRRKEVPKRQWILQEQVEFLETMMAKRQQRNNNSNASAVPTTENTISSRYEGIPEHNPSQYCLVEQPSDDTTSTVLQVTLLPTPNGTITFSQPKARKTLSMSEAELAIEDQRGKMTRFMMHDKQKFLHSAVPTPSTSESRKRLFGKLQKVQKSETNNNEEEDDDDIMGDLAFRNRKGSGRARKELLDSLGDSNLKVDADGVLGGTNDSEFGKGQKFGRFNADQQHADKVAENGGGGEEEGGAAEPTSKGADGLAMADDFYQRDVQAEYEELDYDVNEQFDDDDVDVGETEVVVEGSGFADDDDEDDPDEDELDDKPSGAEGLASVAGFRLLLAKARGEITPEQAAEAAEGAKLKEKQKEEYERRADESKKRKRNEEDDHLAQIMAAAEKSREEAERKKKEAEAAQLQQPATKQAKLNDDATGVQVDENGQRIITLKAVQKEIWLRHGTIPMKRLMKIFDIKKKTSVERQNKFREVVKELCTMETDPVDGRMLVLKQHYSAMG